jgi:hypothetical protein
LKSWKPQLNHEEKKHGKRKRTIYELILVYGSIDNQAEQIMNGVFVS